MLAEAGAPDYVLESIRPGRSLTDLMEEAERQAPELDDADVLASLEEAMAPALAGKGDPFQAEAAGAELLAILKTYAPLDEPFTDSPAFVARVLDVIRLVEKAATPAALALLRTVALHGPPETRPAAAAAADGLVANGLPELPFADVLGRPTPHDCFSYRDVFGEQESIALTFGYGRRKHAICVLIDYGLGGGVKDCWATEKVAGLKRRYRALGDGPAIYEDLPLADGLTRLRAALAAEPCPEQFDQIRDTESYLPLLRQRVALVAEAVAAGSV